MSTNENDIMMDQYYRDLGEAAEAEYIDNLVKESIEEYNKLHGGPTPEYYFHRAGDFWLVSYSNKRAFIENLKGMTFLAILLKSPAKVFNLNDLFLEVNPLPADQALLPKNNFIESIDPTAKDQILSRKKELQGLEDKEGENEERMKEIEDLEKYLSQNTVGGRVKNLNSEDEKKRKSIWKIIDKAIERIGEYLPELGMHLKNSIKTGSQMSYTPEKPINWSF